MKQQQNITLLAVLVVLYQKATEDSIALQSLLKQVERLHQAGIQLRIHVWNNSPGVARQCSGVRWHEGKNVSLSLIYNQIAAEAFSENAQLFMISDDDTDYTKVSMVDCCRQVEFALNSPEGQQCGVFLPRLVSHGQLISPGRRWHFLGRLLTEFPAGFTAAKNLLAVNSGVIFSRDCWERMQPFYDERLRFYVTDTDFFIRYEKIFPIAYVLDVQIDHDLSELSDDSLARALFRFEEMVWGLRISFSTHSLGVRGFLELYLGYAALRKGWSYRSWKFITTLISKER